MRLLTSTVVLDYDDLGKHERAIEDYDKAIELNP